MAELQTLQGPPCSNIQENHESYCLWSSYFRHKSTLLMQMWVIRNDRRSSWADKVLKDNPIIEGKWWDLDRPDKLQISLDSKIAKDFDIKIGDIFTLNIYGREIEGEIVNFRLVDYRDFTINFAMLLNPQFAKNIPHEYLATSKFKNLENFDETALLDKMPSLSIIKITDYLEKVTDLLNKVFIAVTVISAITIVIGLIVISSAIIVQRRVKLSRNDFVRQRFRQTRQRRERRPNVSLFHQRPHRAQPQYDR